MQLTAADHARSATLAAGVLAACCVLPCGCGDGGRGGGPDPAVEMERMGLLGGTAVSPGPEYSLEQAAWVPDARLAALLEGVDAGERAAPRIVIEKPGDGRQPESPAGRQRDDDAGRFVPADGLEAAPGWSSTSWSAPVKIEVAASSLAGMRGKVLLLSPLSGAAERSPPAADAGTPPRKVVVALPLPMPGGKADPTRGPGWAPGRLSLHAACVGTGSVALAVAVESGPRRTYYESPVLVLSPGAAREFAVSLAAAIWKCAASGWKFSAAVAPGRLHRVFILVYEPASGTRVMIDRLRVAARQVPRASPPGGAANALRHGRVSSGSPRPSSREQDHGGNHSRKHGR